VYSMLTVRYLTPIYLLGLYGVVRLTPVGDCVALAPRVLGLGYAATVGLGTIGFLAAVFLLEPALGEAVQLHAIVNLSAAGALALVVIARTLVPDRIRPSWLAGTLAVAAGLTTVYLLFAAIVYFTYGNFAFDGVRVIADMLATSV